jgi:hypothetical protein
MSTQGFTPFRPQTLAGRPGLCWKGGHRVRLVTSSPFVAVVFAPQRSTPGHHLQSRVHSIPTANARTVLCSLLKGVRRRGRWHHRQLLPVLLHHKEVLLGIISIQGFIFFQPLMLARHSVLCRRDLGGEVGDIITDSCHCFSITQRDSWALFLPKGSLNSNR